LRVNTLKTTADELVEALHQSGHVCGPNALVTDAVRLDAVRGPIQSLPGYEEGFFAVQDLASQMIGPLLKPSSNHRILDACAAPGGKTAHIAALTQNLSSTVAVDCDEVRVEETRDNLRRLGVERVELRVGDSQDIAFIETLGTFDRILVDAPCTGLGVLRHNPEAKYRLQEKDLAVFGARQLRLLTAAARALEAGGLLVYSVCTVSQEETWDVIEAFLHANPDYSLDPIEQAEVPAADLLDKRGAFTSFPSPVAHAMDGFFAARIRRKR
jgi:16S rRNA (cytosine967-C5)-methyltransferase